MVQAGRGPEGAWPMGGVAPCGSVSEGRGPEEAWSRKGAVQKGHGPWGSGPVWECLRGAWSRRGMAGPL